jgi:hypothetical protein
LIKDDFKEGFSGSFEVKNKIKIFFRETTFIFINFAKPYKIYIFSQTI